MIKAMKVLFASLTLAAIVALTGCAYGGVGVSADGHAVVARNDAFLFGLLRKVFVCQVSPTGLTACGSGESP